MIDRRDSRANDRVAHVSMRGRVEADLFVEGDVHIVTWPPLAVICDAPFGKRERELLWGQGFCVLEVVNGMAFGFATGSGYTGYVEAHMLRPASGDATHVVQARATMALGEADFKAVKAEHVPLSMGSAMRVLDVAGRWARIAGAPHDLFVPVAHLRDAAVAEDDPVAVAERLVGTPYVWGGNSSFGIDCSGLVQIACDACGIACPGDSDQQMAQMGSTMPDGTPPKRGDLLFWKGHVAWVADQDTILHANAHHMAVAFEPLQTAIDRIAAQGDGPVLRHARFS